MWQTASHILEEYAATETFITVYQFSWYKIP